MVIVTLKLKIVKYSNYSILFSIPCLPGWFGSAPNDFWFLFLPGTLGQKVIDQSLIRYAGFFGQILEVGNGIFIQPDRDGFLEPAGIKILDRIGEIVVFTHFGILHRKLPADLA